MPNQKTLFSDFFGLWTYIKKVLWKHLSLLPLFFSGHPRPLETALMVGRLGAFDVGGDKPLYAPPFHLAPSCNRECTPHVAAFQSVKYPKSLYLHPALVLVLISLLPRTQLLLSWQLFRYWNPSPSLRSSALSCDKVALHAKSPLEQHWFVRGFKNSFHNSEGSELWRVWWDWSVQNSICSMHPEGAVNVWTTKSY